jgi:uncharacterized protein YdgA (DUF945 family)
VKRKAILVSIISIFVIVTGYSSAAWWIGKAAENTVQKQVAWFKSQPYFIVKGQVYNRGWFSSDAVTTLAINPNLYAYIAQRTGEAVAPFEMRYKQHITHGPLPLLSSFNPMPYKAVISTEFVFPPEIQKRLIRFFGKEKPLTMVERIAFNDDSQAKIIVPGFDYEEAISGIKAKWSGFKGEMEYSGDFSSRFKLHGLVADAEAFAKPKGIFALRNLSVDIDTLRGKTGLMLGTHALTLDNLNINWLDGTPLHLIFNKIAYSSNLTEGGDYINGEGKFNAASLVLNTKTYGPARFLGEAKHLHAPTLALLSKEITQLQKDGMGAVTMIDEAIVEVFRKHGAPLLEHNPELAIRELFMKTPDGDIRLTADLGLKGFEKTDMNSPVHLLNKIHATADISIPRQVLEAMIVLQAQTMLGSESEQDSSNEDMQLLIHQIVEGQINKLAQEKYIRIEGNNIITHLTLQQGNLTLNGIPVVMPWQQSTPRVAKKR